MRNAPPAEGSVIGHNRPPEEPTPRIIEKWSVEKKEAFRQIGMAALVLVASDGPVSVTLWGPSGEKTMIGHNRAVWPAKWAKTKALTDTVTQNHDKDPFVRIGSQFEIWCLSEEHRDRLADAALDFLRERADRDGGMHKLRKDYADLGPDLDFSFLEMEIHVLAERLQIKAYDRDGMSRFVDGIERRACEILRSPKAPRDLARVYDLAVAKELGI